MSELRADMAFEIGEEVNGATAEVERTIGEDVNQ